MMKNLQKFTILLYYLFCVKHKRVVRRIRYVYFILERTEIAPSSNGKCKLSHVKLIHMPYIRDRLTALIQLCLIEDIMIYAILEILPFRLVLRYAILTGKVADADKGKS